MAGVLFVYEGAVARRCRRRTRPCVFVCCVFVCCCCCCCCCSCTPGFVVWLVWMCEVWFSSCSGSESLLLRLQEGVGIPRWPEPTSPFSHFPPAPTSSGRGILVVIYARLVRSTRLVKSNKMQQNVAKSGWELTKVARIGRSRSVYGLSLIHI